ncbi:MAG: lactate dehydrogenase [Anaerolineae bacterium]|nr:MAG: lactate dehydrogenase [Anaerolineae bacterium]
MTMVHRVLMTGHAVKERADFYRQFTPAEFELVWVEKPDDPAVVAATLKDVEFSYGGALPADWLDAAPRLKLMQLAGVGYSEAAVQVARERGVPVAITPEGTCLGVAEGTILLILALYKHLIEAHQAMREGRWIHHQVRAKSYFFHDKVLGIVGLGRIGTDVVLRARGFQPRRIVYYDLFRQAPERERELGVEYLELDELLEVSDIVSLHVYLSERSKKMIGERELGLMKPTAILINTARGAVVDEEALYRALRDGKIRGAGLDAWTQEPTPPDNPILQLDNVVCTPHMATATVDADRMKYQAAMANFQRVLRGEPPLNVVEKLYSEVEATLD